MTTDVPSEKEEAQGCPWALATWTGKDVQQRTGLSVTAWKVIMAKSLATLPDCGR